MEGGGLDDLVHDPEQLERVGGADHQVVVGVEAAVEVEAAELARLKQQRDDELDVHAGRVVPGVDDHLRLVAERLAVEQGGAPVGHVGRVEGRLEQLVLEQHPLAVAQPLVDGGERLGEPVLAGDDVVLARVVGAVGEPELEVPAAGRVHDVDALEEVRERLLPRLRVGVADAPELVVVVLEDVGVDRADLDAVALGVRGERLRHPVLAGGDVVLAWVVRAVGEPELEVPAAGRVHDVDALKEVRQGLLPRLRVGVADAAELVVVVLEDVGVDRADPDAVALGVRGEGRVVVDLVPGDVHGHDGGDAGVLVYLGGVVGLLVGVPGHARLAEHLEPGPAVAERPGRQLDLVILEGALDRGQVTHSGSSPISRSALARASPAGSGLLVKMEDLGNPGEGLVWRPVGDEEVRHFGLPPPVDVGRGHRVERGLVVIGLQVADKQAVCGQEDRVVAPAEPNM